MNKHEDGQMSTSITIKEFKSLRYLYFRLFNEDESFLIQFNIHEINTTGKQIVSTIDSDAVEIDEFVQAPKEADLNFNITIRSNLSLTELHFNGLNTSAIPAEVFKLYSFRDNRLRFGLADEIDGQKVVTIKIDKEVAQYGGVLFIVVTDQRENGYILKSARAWSVGVRSPITKQVMPAKSLAVTAFPYEKNMYLESEKQSLFCTAMGAKTPEVSIYRKSDNGDVISEVNGYITGVDAFSVSKEYQIQQGKYQEGTYVCR